MLLHKLTRNASTIAWSILLTFLVNVRLREWSEQNFEPNAEDVPKPGDMVNSTVAAAQPEPAKTKRPLPPPGPVKVLLVTYYRGGASLLGQVFNQNPEAFYWYEPPKAVFDAFTRTHREENEMSAYGYELNGRPPSVQMEEFHGQITRMVRDMFDCRVRLEDLPTGSWLTGKPRSKDVADAFHSCTKTPTKDKDEVLKRCLLTLRRSCIWLKLRAVKTTGMSLRLASKVLQQDPSVRLFYLTRDPRSVLLSLQEVEGWEAGEGRMQPVSLELCQMMQDDWRSYQSLAAGDPDPRINHVRFEDLVLRPTETLERIYAKLLLPVPGRVKFWLNKYTKLHLNLRSPQQGDESAMQAEASFNASSYSTMVNRWRTELKPEELRLVEQNCARVIQQMGYPT